MPGRRRAARLLRGCKDLATAESQLDAAGLSLRPARAGDLASLVALDRVCFGRRAWSVRGWREVVADPGWTALVATVDGAVVAATVLVLGRPASSLASIAVHPGLRGRGVGRLLLRDALARARGAGSRLLVLEVDRGNRLAVRLYRQEGFGLLRRFREEGRWRLEMRRRLGAHDGARGSAVACRAGARRGGG